MQHAIDPCLSGFVKSIWLGAPAPPKTVCERERMLPTGEMHLVFRLSGPPVCIFEGQTHTSRRTLGHALVGGARSGFYVKDCSVPSQAIGVQLLPGAAHALLGQPASEFAGRHVALEDLWGPQAGLMLEQLLAATSPGEKIRTFQSLLGARLQAAKVPALHPVVRDAVQQFAAGATVRQAVERSGYSHRQFIRLFWQAVGLTPKLYCRLALMRPCGDQRPGSLAEVAAMAGYSDQAHFNREFSGFSGTSPERYRMARTTSTNHLPIPEPRNPAKTPQVNFVQYPEAARR